MIWITIFPGFDKAGLPYTFLLTVFKLKDTEALS